MKTAMQNIRKAFLPILAVLMVFTAASIPPDKAPAAIPINSAIFEGSVMGTDLSGGWLEYYVNHNEQRATIRINVEANGTFSYRVAIPLANFPEGSRVTFKMNEQVFGISILEPGKHIFNLAQDEQSH